MKLLLKMLLALSALVTLTYAANQNETFKVKTVTGKELTFTGTADGLITSPYEGKVDRVVISFNTTTQGEKYDENLCKNT